MSTTHFCAGARCPGYPYPASQIAHPASCVAPEPRRLTCGCCTDGCVCSIHCDIPRGLLVRTCAFHASGRPRAAIELPTVPR